MRLNPYKCAFAVQAGKFLGFMLTSRGIQANPEKCEAILTMRSPASLKKELKTFLAAPSTLSRPEPREELSLYLSVTANALSAVLVREEGSRAGIILEGPSRLILEQSLRFNFKATNNQAEYEALIAGLSPAKEIGASRLIAKSDSQLVTNQVKGEFQTKEPQLGRYLHKVRTLGKSFDYFQIEYIPREQNARANLLSKLASTKKPGNNQSVIQKALDLPTVDLPNIQIVEAAPKFWGTLSSDSYKMGRSLLTLKEAKKLRRTACYFTLLKNQLYRRGYSMPLLKCVNLD
ncbi:uncharacterized protein LOC127805529 [Diospyros lotus]|uniref:uncharacterized protein LOC127805529 n=1 Tax=Diospyros lotus TaxID=55363 RepID=UPI00224CE128|nr:uncharacterized protein LOC127805529 [Diospyros lotus]